MFFTFLDYTESLYTIPPAPNNVKGKLGKNNKEFIENPVKNHIKKYLFLRDKIIIRMKKSELYGKSDGKFPVIVMRTDIIFTAI